jgi:SAM-dependent methyltransferase
MQSDEIHRMTEIEEHHWWYRERRSLLARELRRLGTPGRALDIGAAGGGNTRVLVEHGWDTLASDYSETAVGIAGRRGVPVIRADARDLPLASGTFDLVTAFEILEHIDDDARAAAEIFRVLRPGGVALLTVPCDMNLWSAHDVAVGHVRRYSRQELATVVEAAGFTIDRLWSWNVLLRPAVAIHRRRSTGSDIVETSRLLNLVLNAVIVAERYLPVSGWKGVSLILRAHRR